MKLEPITVNLYSLYYKENHGVVSLDVSEGSVRLPSLLDMRGRNWNARDCPNEKGVRYSFNHNDINWSPRNSKEEDGKNRTPHIYPKENERKWNSYRNHSSVRPLPTQHYSAHSPNTLSFRSLTLALAQRPFHLQLSLHSLSFSLSLSVVSRVNAISRAVTAGSLSMEQGFAQLEELSRTPPQPLWQGLLANGLSASFFALLFHGGGFDFAVALVCGLLTRLLGLLFSEDSVSSTLYALLSGALSAVVAVLSVRFFHMGNQTPIIIGAIMPLLPGLAITNAIRDTVNGDLVSGVARTAEALLKAVAIAAGVGTVLALLH